MRATAKKRANAEPRAPRPERQAPVAAPTVEKLFVSCHLGLEKLLAATGAKPKLARELDLVA